MENKMTQKSIKRLFAAVLMTALMIAAAGLTGCGDKYGDSEYLGTWKCTSGEAQGMKIDVSKTMGDFEITLKADGTANADVFGKESTAEWEPTKEGFDIIEDKENLSFKKSGMDMTLDYSGVTITFEQQ